MKSPSALDDPYLGVTLVGKYRLTAVIGAGAMGRVYQADHLILEAEVAIKLLDPELSADPHTLQRFHTEARAASRLRHPNTIQVFDFGQAESGLLFLAMERLRGRTLAQLLDDEGPLLPARLASLLGQALLALDEAHAAGVVHRDFKPENIFVETLRTGQEHVKVLDFGIAKLRGEVEPAWRGVSGTPEYMSPEQIRGEELDARSDLYAAGVVLYEALTGRRPFASDQPMADLLRAHLDQPPPPPSSLGAAPCPPALEALCLKALAKAREARFRSAAEMKQALEQAVSGLIGGRCGQCDAALPGSARFCPECGAVLQPTGSFALKAARVASPPRLPLPLVGREEVLARLEGLTEEALLVVGDPGMGKTAVAEAWVDSQRGRFRQVVVVGADPSGAATPWYPVRRALAQLLGLPERPSPSELAGVVGPNDVPGLGELFGVGGVASKLPLDVRERECVAAALGTLRRGQGVLVFEDADRYDEPSRRLLAKLMELPGTATVLATATRPEAVDVEVEVVRLTALSPPTLEELQLPPGLVERSGGVPLAIVEALRAAGGGLSRADALPPSARQLLEAVVVAGGDVPTAVLAQVAGVTDVGRALAELTLHGFVRATQQRLELCSPTAQKRLYDAIPLLRRQALHSQLTALLEARGADPVVVGLHAYRSGDRRRTPALERAGDAARQGFDDLAAVTWYRAALQRGREALAEGGGDEASQLRLALKLARVLRYRGEVSTSERVLHEALELAQARADRWSAVQAHRGLLRVLWQRDDLDGAAAQLQAALATALGAGDAALLAELYLELAELLLRRGDGEGALRELAEGLWLVTAGEGAAAEKGPEPSWRLLLGLGQGTKEAGRAAEARRFALAALRHADRADNPLGRAQAHRLLAELERELGQPALGTAHWRRALDELRRVGDRRGTVELLLSVWRQSGAEAAELVAEAEALAQELDWREGFERARRARQLLEGDA